jgi:uncharacterized protein (DUF433 family)
VASGIARPLTVFQPAASPADRGGYHKGRSLAASSSKFSSQTDTLPATTEACLWGGNGENAFMKNNVYHSDPEILGGAVVFVGTRVPVRSLFDHLEENIPLETFLDDFPTVTREQCVAV